MDSWSQAQIDMMKRGGNGRLRDWFGDRGVPNNMRISAKYLTPDATYFAKRLKAEVEGKEMPAMPPRMPVDASVDYTRGDPKGKEKLRDESDEDYIARQRMLTDEAKARMRAKFGAGSGSMAGSMAGVGSDPSYVPGGGGGGGGIDVASVTAGLGTLWGSLAETASAARERLAEAELGRKLKEKAAAAHEVATAKWVESVDEETRATLRAQREKAAGVAKVAVGKVAAALAEDDGGGDAWDDWGDSKPKRFPRTSSSGGGGGSTGNLAGMSDGSSGGDGISGGGGGAWGGGGDDECPPGPGEDKEGRERLTGESEDQYARRQIRIRDEAKERMRLKFGGGGLGGVGSSSTSSFSSSLSSSSYGSSSYGSSSSSERSSPPLSVSSWEAAAPVARPAQPQGMQLGASPKPMASPTPAAARPAVASPKPATTDFFADFGT